MREDEVLYYYFVNDNNVVFKADGLEDLNLIMTKKLSELFSYVESHRNELKTVVTKDIPQFSNLKNVITVLRIILDSPEKDLTWEKLGYYMCPKNSNTSARVKYGENHYKLACQLGLAYYGKPLSVSELGLAIYLQDKKCWEKAIARLTLRIPIVQQILIEAMDKRVFIIPYLRKYLSGTTVIRRRSSIKRLFELIFAMDDEGFFENAFYNLDWSNTDAI